MIKACKQCGRDFKTKPSNFEKRVYCTKSCMSEAYKTTNAGDKNPNHKGPKIKRCQTCGKEYDSGYNNKKFCSRKCYGQSEQNLNKLKSMAQSSAAAKTKYKKKNGLFVLKCKKCSADIFGGTRGRSYCEPCRKIVVSEKKRSEKKPNRRCAVCGSLFFAYPSISKKTCSTVCLSRHKSEIQKGAKSHRWQGGKTDHNMAIRNSHKYKQWRSFVFERDCYTCQECGQVGGKLNADHILPFAQYPEFRFDVDNGRTLCVECHRKTKTWGRKSCITLPVSNEREIVKAFMVRGASVVLCHAVGNGCPRLIIGYCGINTFVEILAPEMRGSLGLAQKAFHDEWQGAAEVVETEDDVARLLMRLRSAANLLERARDMGRCVMRMDDMTAWKVADSGAAAGGVNL